MAKASALIFLMSVFLSGCSSLAYYSQAVGGHMEVMLTSRPIADIIEDETTDPALKNKLEEVRIIRDFASRELGLPDNDSYRSYADLKRPFVTWNVFAAAEFSLQTENRCMLVVGCVGYRGFYDQRDAELFASELRERGFDTYVGGIPAYSTLGYFSDPVLNTFLRSGSLEVARLIFHELAHQILYVEDDTVFNESFATAVENEGLRRWLASKASIDGGRSLTAQHQRKVAFFELVTSYHERLQEVYASDQSDAAKRLAKTEIMTDLKTTYLHQQKEQGAPPVYSHWLEHDLNNAKLASLGLYTQLLPTFEAVLEAERYDLPQFYRRVAMLGELPYSKRKAALSELQPHPAAPSSNLAAHIGAW
jgi:predicted aminopeptidase